MLRVTIRALPLADMRVHGGWSAIKAASGRAVQTDSSVLEYRRPEQGRDEQEHMDWSKDIYYCTLRKPLHVSSNEIQQVFNTGTALEKFKSIHTVTIYCCIYLHMQLKLNIWVIEMQYKWLLIRNVVECGDRRHSSFTVLHAFKIIYSQIK